MYTNNAVTDLLLAHHVPLRMPTTLRLAEALLHHIRFEDPLTTDTGR
jgi:hypothetical protein